MKLNPRERNLALLFGAVIFLLANLILLPNLHSGIPEARSKRAEIEGQLRGAQAWIDQREYWQARAEWIRDSQPEIGNVGEESAAQLENLQASARELGLELADITLLSPSAQNFYRPVAVRFSVVGPWPAVVQFLAGIQSQSHFNVIPRLSIRSGQEVAEVFAELEVQRWFQNQSHSR